LNNDENDRPEKKSNIKGPKFIPESEANEMEKWSGASKNGVVHRPKFGKIIELTNDTYINKVDNQNKNFTVISHIYDIVSCLIIVSLCQANFYMFFFFYIEC
jgi:hypothetical protein